MYPILQIGPLAIQLPGLLLLAGLWIGTQIAERESARYKLDPGLISNMIFIALAAGIMGARLGYALKYLDLYLSEPLSLLALNPNTLSAMEGMVAGLIAAMIYAQRKRLSLFPTLDTLALGMAVFAIFVALAHLSSGDAFGAPTTVPWGIELWGADRHPSQIYELLFAVGVTLVILQARKTRSFPGFIFTIFVALAAISRLFLEGFRGDSSIVFGSIRSAQLISFVVMILAMIALHLLSRNNVKGKAQTTA
ncbi:MAG: prolipoprotein diacylglyceryl transferase family protein [Chloroflexota bacterium]|nr:prolipoprotein diacylglyceryl transferase family protein [Chloroflexota bacterium]